VARHSTGEKVKQFLWTIVVYILAIPAMILFRKELAEMYKREDESHADMSML
jgi:hypothetical protein